MGNGWLAWAELGNIFSMWNDCNLLERIGLKRTGKISIRWIRIILIRNGFIKIGLERFRLYLKGLDYFFKRVGFGKELERCKLERKYFDCD